MADDLVFSLPVGARVLVFANLHLSSAPTAASSRAAFEIARTIGTWSGPGAVVLAGGTFDFADDQVDVPGALDAHGTLGDALREFSAAPGRRVVVLPGRCDPWLADPGVSAVLRARVGAEVAPAVVAELLTAGGVRRARIEPGDRLRASPAAPGPSGPPEPGHQRLADVFPGLWRGSTSGWLAGLSQLDDPSATNRFVASRLVYRQLGRRAWLLAVPVVLALLLRLPVALLRPARHISGILLATTLGAAAVESVVLVALAVVSLRQIWLAFSGRPGGRRDLNEAARAAGRQLASAGWAGLVTGATGRAELSTVGTGFYANAGCCGDVVSEYAPRGASLGLPSAFLAARQLAWIELETGNELHARLLYAQVLLPGATVAERLLTRAPVLPRPVVVASFPHGKPWPAVPGRTVPHRRSRRMASLVVAAAGFLSLVSDLSAPVAHHLNVLRQFLPLAVPQAAGALAALGGLALLVLARGIRRGQRRAYLVCQATLVAVATLHLLGAGNVIGAIIALVVAGFLWLRRASFRAASDVPPVRQALARLGALALAAVVAGTLALEGTSWVTTTVHHRRSARIGWAKPFRPPPNA